MLYRLDQSALLAAWRRMGRLVHDLRIAQPRASLSSQGSVVSPLWTAQLTTAMAPLIKRHLGSRWLIFDILPSRGLAPRS